MASDKVTLPGKFDEVGSIAQALKFQIRSGSHWDDIGSTAQEALDQISTTIARMVVGDGVHWDAIINYAQAAKPSTADPAPMRSVAARTAQHVGIEAIERSFRDIPHREEST